MADFRIEAIGFLDWWNGLSIKAQQGYLKSHSKSDSNYKWAIANQKKRQPRRKRMSATDMGLPNLREIRQTVGKDNHAMIEILRNHNRELVRKQCQVGNWGWVIDEYGIASKTSCGILATDKLMHIWRVDA
jgi:hypothetical protein